MSKSLFQLLQSYKPLFPEEVISKARMLDFLEKHGNNSFDRNLSEGHFTGSAWISNHGNSKFLLTLHKKLGILIQLGGHADGDPDIFNVAQKEAFEESGLKTLTPISLDIFDIDIHEIPQYKDVPAHLHYDVRFILSPRDPNDSIQISDESLDLKWFEVLPLPTSQSMIRMFEKWERIKFQI